LTTRSKTLSVPAHHSSQLNLAPQQLESIK